MADPAETTQASETPVGGEHLLEAVRALAAQVGGLRAEVQALRSERNPLPAPAGDRPGWADAAPARSDLAWIRSLERPASRRLPVPRLLLEIVFLAAVALAAALAELEWPAVVAAMAGAWILVALAEWIGARAERRLDEVEYRLYSEAGPVLAEDPSWFAPPVERTALEGDDGAETAARLPPVTSG